LQGLNPLYCAYASTFGPKEFPEDLKTNCISSSDKTDFETTPSWSQFPHLLFQLLTLPRDINTRFMTLLGKVVKQGSTHGHRKGRCL